MKSILLKIAKVLGSLLFIAIFVGSLQGNYYQYKLYNQLLPKIEELERDSQSQSLAIGRLFDLTNYAVREVDNNKDILYNLKAGKIVEIKIKEE